MRRFVMTLTFFAFWVLAFSNSVGAQNIDPATKILHFSQMAQKAAEQGSIRVIVQLRVPEIKAYTSASAQFNAGRSDAATIVRATSADGALAAQIATTANDLFSRTGFSGIQVQHRYSALPLLALDVSLEALETLAQDPYVLQITEDHLARPMLNNTVDIIGASDSWGDGYTGTGWYVAILDTGIRSSHEFFSGKDIVEACYSDDSHCPNNGTSMTGVGSAAHHPSSYFGWDHGTHVAGIAAGNDDPNLNGVAIDADIIAVQVFSRFNDPGRCGANNPCVLAYTSDILAGLNYIFSLRAIYNIAAVNLSLGSGYYATTCDGSFPAYKTAIDLLNSAGIATVVASGNENYCDGTSAPGCISTAVTVGATTDADVMTSFSNYREELVDLFAPGSFINSSVGDADNAYESWSGTSMATPHVTGAFALLRQANGTSSVTDLLTALLDNGESVDDSANCGDDGTLPTPRIEVNNAIVPIAPDGLGATAVNWDQVMLTWNDNANNEQGFKIERKTGAGGAYSEIADVAANTTTHNDTSALSEGTTYYYRIRAYNGASNSANSSEANALTFLAAPSGFAATAISDTEIDLSWTDNSSAESGFAIDRRTSSGTFAAIAAPGTDSETFSDTGLIAGTTYYYRIRSTNGSGTSLYAQTSTYTTGGGGGSSSGGCFLSVMAQ